MGHLTVFNSVTLDGVLQAPGHPEEDKRGGFDHGGWALPYQDEVIAKFAAKGMAQEGSLLFGRWTYESFHSYWPNQSDNPFTDVLNRSVKYVTSRTLSEPLPWENSILLEGEAEETVARVKSEDTRDITLLGSGRLLQTLIRHDLVDTYVLLIHPLMLGSGQRMFPEGHRTELALTDVTPTTTGVMVATYSRTE